MIRTHRNTRGFSLVELSIVLVILGLLVGGVLSGQSLIRAAELRGLASEAEQFMTASHTFRDKYFSLPGDMTNATRFWGDDAALCADASVPNGVPGTCNGNGNGKIDSASTGNATGEMFQFWKQLALAGLITGNFNGSSGSNGHVDSTFTNSPRSKVTQGGWTMLHRSLSDAAAASYTIFFNRFEVNILHVGNRSSGANGSFVNKFISPAEAWNIDTKIDDGKPGQGRVMALHWDDCTSAANWDDFNASYLLSDTRTDLCALTFPNLL